MPKSLRVRLRVRVIRCRCLGTSHGEIPHLLELEPRGGAGEVPTGTFPPPRTGGQGRLPASLQVNTLQTLGACSDDRLTALWYRFWYVNTQTSQRAGAVGCGVVAEHEVDVKFEAAA